MGVGRICKDCGIEFFISERTEKFFQEKGWAMPIRCKPCREQKKLRANSPFKPAMDMFQRSEE